MTLGERIAERLSVLGISQSELARRTGVPQTTVNSLVRGNNRTTPHLIKLARELGTTPAYLMGEVDSPGAEFQLAELSGAERALIARLRMLEDDEVTVVSSMVDLVVRLRGKTEATPEISIGGGDVEAGDSGGE